MEEANINDKVKAVYALCNLKNSYEKENYFVKTILVNAGVIEKFLYENVARDYEIIKYNGNKEIEKFLADNSNFSKEQKQKNNLLVFNTENSNLLSKKIWTIRCVENITKRKWLINQVHWDGCWSELKQNLWDTTLDFTGDSGQNYIKRMIADDW